MSGFGLLVCLTPGEFTWQSDRFAHLLTGVYPGRLEVDLRPDLHTCVVAPARVTGSDTSENDATLTAGYGADGGLLGAVERAWSGDMAPLAEARGPFAGASVRRSDRTIMLVRDHFGQAPCFYAHLPGRLIAVASAIPPLLGLAGVSGELDDRQIAALLANDHRDVETTAYHSIRRVPPATVVQITQEGTTRRRFWALPTEPYLDLTAGEAAETVRRLLDDAVGHSLEGSSAPGSQLSGGMDSSAITLLAARRSAVPIQTISNRFPTVTECDEGPWIDVVAAAGGARRHERPADDIGPLTSFEAAAHWWADPIVGPNYYLVDGLFTLATSCGVDVMLDGFDGDSVISHGANGLVDLMMAGAWDQYLREATLLEQSGQASILDLQRAYVEPVLGQMIQAHRYGSALRGMRSLAKGTGYTTAGLTRSALRHRRSDRRARKATATPPLLRPDTWIRYAMTPERREAVHPEGEAHRAHLSLPILSNLLESLHQLVARYGVENRHPFFDRSLVEFTVRLPPSTKLRDGWTRRVLRDALADIYPPETRWRVDKTDMTPAFLRGFRHLDRQLVQHSIGRPLERLDSIVDVQQVRASAHHLTSDTAMDEAQVMSLWRVLSCAVWMDAHDHDLS